MAKLSEDAFAILAGCEEARGKTFGITVDKVSNGDWKLVWPFKIDRDKAKREGFTEKQISGQITLDPDYPGCPYCGSKEFYVCNSCGNVACYHGKEYVTCPHCGNKGQIISVEKVNLKGGGF